MDIKSILDKLTSYNLFNYLFPGSVFVILLRSTTDFICDPELNLSTVILVYFTGLIISRIGSLVIEEILLQFKGCKPIDTKLLFKKFKGNVKLEIIFEAMNMYRTLAAMSLILAIITLIDLVFISSFSTENIIWILAELAASLLFICSFYKQRKKVLECVDPRKTTL